MPDPTTRTFTLDDQHAFAALSGDCNPMHVDPNAARRFMYGEVVVHGIHVLMNAIERLLAANGDIASLERVSAEFRTPVRLETPVAFEIEPTDDPGRVRITAIADATPAMRATVSWAHAAAAASIPVPDSANTPGAPAELLEGDMSDVSGTTPAFVDPERLARLLPATAARLPASQVAALLASTRVVGMLCPGFHSVFSDLDMRFGQDADASPTVRYELARYDERFRLATMALAGAGQAATVKAFLRPPPQPQPGVDEVAAAVTPGCFEGRRALVVGGSRGLGELVTKLLAAGGADVVFTYRSGKADAERLVDALGRAGHEVRAVAYDAGRDAAALSRQVSDWAPTDLCYFATPVIHKTDQRAFVAGHFEKFGRVYVSGFAESFDLAVSAGALARVLYPSSVAVSEHTKGMAEYAAAKTAGESLCAYLAQRHPDIQFRTPRLPRLATDQTASVLAPAQPADVSEFFRFLAPS